MLDFIATSAAIDRAIEVLDLHGHVAAAEHLRVHGPELLSLARIGQRTKDARDREPETPPPVIGPKTERLQGHG
jgi:hypothetical protein